jgi:hypothetical protein
MGRVMKTLPTLICLAALPLTGFAQLLDAAVAAEALRGATLNSAVNILGRDGETAGNYREIAMEQALAVQAGRLGLDERIDVQRAMANARRNVMVQALREEVERQVPPPDEAGIKDLYEKNKSAFVSPSAYQLTVYEWPASVKFTAAELTVKLTGTDIEKAVADSGGRVVMPAASTEWLVEARMIPQIWTGLAAMKDGETKWFDGETGKVRVTRRAYREPKPLTFDEARADATRVLVLRMRAEAWQRYLLAMQQQLGLAPAPEAAPAATPATKPK